MGWEIKKLGDVLIKTEMVDPRKKPNDEIIYIDVSSVNKEKKIIEDVVTILGKDAPSRARKLVRTGDVIFATVRPTHSRVAIISKELDFQVCSTGYFVLRGNQNIINKYLYYFIQTDEFNKKMEKLQKGAKYPAVTDSDVKNILIKYPSSPSEQQHIVSILDTCFAAIDKAKANAEQNLKNAKELFESYLQGVFENKGVDWVEKKLGDVCIVERGSSPRPIENFITNSIDGVNWIKIGDTKKVDKYIYSTKEKITKEGAEKSRYVKDGDFILSNSMSFGKPYIMKTDGYIHDGWFVFRLPTYIDNDFFYYLLISPIVQKQIQSLGAGAIVKNISGDLVKRVDLFYPKSINAQKELVRQLDNMRLETKKLEKVFSNKISDLNELKKSILQKAFAGELKTEKAVKI